MSSESHALGMNRLTNEHARASRVNDQMSHVNDQMSRVNDQMSRYSLETYSL